MSLCDTSLTHRPWQCLHPPDDSLNSRPYIRMYVHWEAVWSLLLRYVMEHTQTSHASSCVCSYVRTYTRSRAPRTMHACSLYLQLAIEQNSATLRGRCMHVNVPKLITHIHAMLQCAAIYVISTSRSQRSQVVPSQTCNSPQINCSGYSSLGRI